MLPPQQILRPGKSRSRLFRKIVNTLRNKRVVTYFTFLFKNTKQKTRVALLRIVGTILKQIKSNFNFIPNVRIRPATWPPHQTSSLHTSGACILFGSAHNRAALRVCVRSLFTIFASMVLVLISYCRQLTTCKKKRGVRELTHARVLWWFRVGLLFN